MPDLNFTLRTLVHHLSDGEWHSGEDLGELIGVSRAAISKQLKQVASLGLKLETVKGRGYRLRKPLDLYDAQQLDQLLSLQARARLGERHIHYVIDSTNEFLMQRAREGAQVHAEVCLAEQQLAGRGRRGRQWHSPFAENVYLTLAWRFEDGVSAIEGLSLAVGVSVCAALEKLGFDAARLKWPNDLLVNGKKLGGVLVELAGDAVSDCLAVIGVGLNLHMSSDENDVGQPWASLDQLGFGVSKNVLVAAVLNELVDLLENYQEQGFSRYRDAWNERNAFAGQMVDLISASSSERGKLLGVNSSGALVMESIDGSEKIFIGGEVSLRKSK